MKTTTVGLQSVQFQCALMHLQKGPQLSMVFCFKLKDGGGLNGEGEKNGMVKSFWLLGPWAWAHLASWTLALSTLSVRLV